jgi:hypothetical protein
MFSLFKKRRPGESLTFKERVESFWHWYASVADQFYQTIERGQCTDLAPEVSAKVDELLPGFAWVFGPGAGGAGHSFTISGEGVLHRQLLALYCVSRAPQLDGWTFYPARQPGKIEGIRMEFQGEKFDPLEFWLTPSVDSESETVNLTVWHPLVPKLGPQALYSPLFLFLDEVLGEFGTGQWLGEINIGNQRLTDAIPLKELPMFIQQVQADTSWNKLPPGESVTLYEPKTQNATLLRGDILVGQTANLNLIQDYLQSGGQLDDPLAGTGADYVFVAFPASFLPEGKQSEARGAIEDALESVLTEAHSGRLLGGAFGQEYAYLDLLLFDGQRSLDLVTQALREQNLPSGTAIHFFAKEKRGQSRDLRF